MIRTTFTPVLLSALLICASAVPRSRGARADDPASLAIAPEDVPTPPTTTVERRTWTPSGVERFYLPVLEEGGGKGFNCFYQAPKFVARVDENGALQVQLLYNGAKVGQPMVMGGAIGGSYHQPLTTGKVAGVPRYMVSLRSALKPSEQPRSKVIIEGELEEDVRFKRTYTFQPGKIIITTGFTCRNVLPTHMGLSVSNSSTLM